MDVRVTTRNGQEVERVEVSYSKRTYRRMARDESGQMAVVEERSLTDQEIADKRTDEGAKAASQRIREAIAGNKAFLDLASPTNAQAVAQVRALTRQMTALLRLQLRDFD